MIGTWLTITGSVVDKPVMEYEGTIEEQLDMVLSKHRNFKVIVRARHFVLIGNNGKIPKRLLLTNHKHY